MELKELRKKLGATQFQFAEELGIDRSLLSKYETGSAPIPAYIQKAIDSTYVLDEDGYPVFIDRKAKLDADIEILKLRNEILSLKKENQSLRDEVKKIDEALELASERRRRDSRNPLPGIEGAS